MAVSHLYYLCILFAFSCEYIGFSVDVRSDIPSRRYLPHTFWIACATSHGAFHLSSVPLGKGRYRIIWLYIAENFGLEYPRDWLRTLKGMSDRNCCAMANHTRILSPTSSVELLSFRSADRSTSSIMQHQRHPLAPAKSIPVRYKCRTASAAVGRSTSQKGMVVALSATSRALSPSRAFRAVWLREQSLSRACISTRSGFVDSAIVVVVVVVAVVVVNDDVVVA